MGEGTQTKTITTWWGCARGCSLKTDIESSKKKSGFAWFWKVFVNDAAKVWCTTREVVWNMCVCPIKISRLLVLTLIVNFRVSLHSPPLPLAILAVGSLWYLMIERTWHITRCSELKFSFFWRTSTVLCLSPDNFLYFDSFDVESFSFKFSDGH